VALDVEAVKAKVRAQAQQQTGAVKTQLERHPLVFLGAALGAGFVAGGGLGGAVSGQLARVGGGLAWRFLVLPALTATVSKALGLAEDQDLDAQGDEDVDDEAGGEP
jgi:hypothetical protein